MHCTSRSLSLLLALLLPAGFVSAQTAATPPPANANPIERGSMPFEWGVFTQGGFGVTENRSNFGFLSAGVHAGKVLTPILGHGHLRGSFEYAMEFYPFWQSYTPTTMRQNCAPVTGAPDVYNCSAPFKIGGTFTGASITPIILRWNFPGSPRIAPWIQGAGGLVWTNHKYPALGGPPVNDGGVTIAPVGENLSNSNTSVWNFTPQFGVGMHYFLRPRRSLDFSANAVHVSSASLGDKNPGVNASVQFTIGYTWWQ